MEAGKIGPEREQTRALQYLKPGFCSIVPMTRYLLYFLIGFAHALLILLYSDLTESEALVHRTVGLAGAVGLFALASWLTFFSMRVGALTALPCLLAILYWNVATVQQVIRLDTPFDTVIAGIHLVLGLLALIALIICLRYIFWRGLPWSMGTRRPGLVLKVLLAAIPVAVAYVYFLYA